MPVSNETGADRLSIELGIWRDAMPGQGFSADQIKMRLRDGKRLVVAIGAASYRELERKQITAWLSKMIAAGIKKKSCKTYLSLLAAWGDTLKGEGAIHVNPTDGIKGPRGSDPPKPKQHPFSAEEVDALVMVAEADESLPEPKRRHGAERSVLYRVLALSGGRKRETGRVRWMDVQLDADTPGVTFMGKNGRNDRVPLAPQAVEALRRWRAKCDLADADAPVFATFPDDRVLLGDMKAAGIDTKDKAGRAARWGSFRKGFATRLVEGDVEPGKAQQLMRHRTCEMTMNVYAQVRQQKLLAEVMKAVDPSGGAVPIKKVQNPSGALDNAGRIGQDVSSYTETSASMLATQQQIHDSNEGAHVAASLCSNRERSKSASAPLRAVGTNIRTEREEKRRTETIRPAVGCGTDSGSGVVLNHSNLAPLGGEPSALGGGSPIQTHNGADACTGPRPRCSPSRPSSPSSATQQDARSEVALSSSPTTPPPSRSCSTGACPSGFSHDPISGNAASGSGRFDPGSTPATDDHPRARGGRGVSADGMSLAGASSASASSEPASASASAGAGFDRDDGEPAGTGPAQAVNHTPLRPPFDDDAQVTAICDEGERAILGAKNRSPQVRNRVTALVFLGVASALGAVVVADNTGVNPACYLAHCALTSSVLKCLDCCAVSCPGKLEKDCIKICVGGGAAGVAKIKEAARILQNGTTDRALMADCVTVIAAGVESPDALVRAASIALAKETPLCGHLVPPDHSEQGDATTTGARQRTAKAGSLQMEATLLFAFPV